MDATPNATVEVSSNWNVSLQMTNSIDEGAGKSDPSPTGITPSPEETVPSIPHFAGTTATSTAQTLGPHRIFLDICAGATRPLSNACLKRGKCVLSFDILVQSQMDLLDDVEYEQLLRLCASGTVAYAGASPSCGQYSRLKLRKGGPPPVRTPDHLNGVPGITPSDLLKVQESHTLLSRCIQCLILVFQAGGHVHLEQPPSAMSWLAGSQSIFTADWCLLHQSSCLRIWLEHSQSLDVCNVFPHCKFWVQHVSTLKKNMNPWREDTTQQVTF
jgi:hypothetical protein